MKEEKLFMHLSYLHDFYLIPPREFNVKHHIWSFWVNVNKLNASMCDLSQEIE